MARRILQWFISTAQNCPSRIFPEIVIRFICRCMDNTVGLLYVLSHAVLEWARAWRWSLFVINRKNKLALFLASVRLFSIFLMLGWRPQSEKSPFDIVSQNLKNIGAVSLSQFLSSPASTIENDSEVQLSGGCFTPDDSLSPESRSPSAALEAVTTSPLDSPIENTDVSRLETECQSVFGSITFTSVKHENPKSRFRVLSALITLSSLFQADNAS